MKKLFSILISLSMVGALLASCGNSGTAASSNAPSAPAANSSAAGESKATDASAAPSASEKAAESKSEGGLNIVTSMYVMEDFAKKIGGDKVTVTNLVPAGTEPHDWEPTSQDIMKLEKAKIFIYNGSGMEHWVDSVLKTLGNKDLVVVEASKGLSVPFSEHKVKEYGAAEDEHGHEHGEEAHEHEDGEEGHDHEHGEEGHDHEHADEGHDHEHEHGEEGHHHHHHDPNAMDPHVWLSPELAEKEMSAIYEGIKKADPANEDYYKQNFEKYEKEFDKLDQEYKDALKTVSKKDIVVTHAAFGYLCDEYDLHEISITGLSPNDEPTPETMAEIIKMMKENDIKTIFFETLASPKVAETIAKETGAKAATLNPIEGLTDQELQAGKDYFSVMRDNLEALKTALK